MENFEQQHPYTYTHTTEADVAAAELWSLYEDVSTWPLWDAQAELVTRDGPFEAGTSGTMKFTGQAPLAYRLATVTPGREFTDETPVGDLLVRVSHLLEPAGNGRTRVTYSATIDGPADEARNVGPMITADFPATMESLITLARQAGGSGGRPPGPAPRAGHGAAAAS